MSQIREGIPTNQKLQEDGGPIFMKGSPFIWGWGALKFIISVWGRGPQYYNHTGDPGSSGGPPNFYDTRTHIDSIHASFSVFIGILYKYKLNTSYILQAIFARLRLLTPPHTHTHAHTWE